MTTWINLVKAVANGNNGPFSAASLYRDKNLNFEGASLSSIQVDLDSLLLPGLPLSMATASVVRRLD